MDDVAVAVVLSLQHFLFCFVLGFFFNLEQQELRYIEIFQYFKAHISFQL